MYRPTGFIFQAMLLKQSPPRSDDQTSASRHHSWIKDYPPHTGSNVGLYLYAVVCTAGLKRDLQISGTTATCMWCLHLVGQMSQKVLEGKRLKVALKNKRPEKRTPEIKEKQKR